MEPETARIEHLRLIQAIIDRMGRNSFAIKAGAVTISAAAVTIAPNSTYAVALAGLPLVLVLWVLDGFFLRQERAFRALYNQIRMGSPAEYGSESYFSMDAEPDRRRRNRLKATWRAMRSANVILLYGALLGFLIVVAVTGE